MDSPPLPRMCSTKEAARRLGWRPEVFLRFRRAHPDFPKPVHGSEKHKWWDYKAIENYFDNQSGIASDSENWDNILIKRLEKNNGEGQNAVRR